ncbi:hypothetical protein IKD48_01315, partial [bacterium]|nr:hypothetical protein [bacterium]
GFLLINSIILFAISSPCKLKFVAIITSFKSILLYKYCFNLSSDFNGMFLFLTFTSSSKTKYRPL